MKYRILFMTMLLVMLVGCRSLPITSFDSPLLPPIGGVDLGPETDYLAAAGIGSIITLVVEILKRLKVLPDGSAGKIATVANVVVFAVLYVAGVFGFDVGTDAAQNIVAILHQVGVLVLQIVSSPVLFGILRNAKVITPMASRLPCSKKCC